MFGIVVERICFDDNVKDMIEYGRPHIIIIGDNMQMWEEKDEWRIEKVKEHSDCVQVAIVKAMRQKMIEKGWLPMPKMVIYSTGAIEEFNGTNNHMKLEKYCAREGIPYICMGEQGSIDKLVRFCAEDPKEQGENEGDISRES